MLCCPSLLYKMSVNKRENIKQIPKEDNLGEVLGEVQKVVSEQGGVEGQRKEVNVGNYANAAALEYRLGIPC